MASLEGIQDAAGHTLLLDSCCPAHQGSACPCPSSAEISQVPGWCILSPSHPSEGTAQAASQGFAQHGLKGAGTKTLSCVTSSLTLWTSGTEKCLLCCAPVLSNSRGDALCAVEPCPGSASGEGARLCVVYGRAPAPRWHSLFPSLCNVPANRRGTESPRHGPFGSAAAGDTAGTFLRAPLAPGRAQQPTGARRHPILPRQDCGVVPARTHTPGCSPAAMPPFLAGDAGGSP